MQYYRIHYFVDVLWLIDMVNMTPLLKDSQSTRLIYRILPVSHAFCNYRPQTKFREGNVFTPVCHSAHLGACIPACNGAGGCLPGDVCQGDVFPRGMSAQRVCPGDCLPGGCTPPWTQRQTPFCTHPLDPEADITLTQRQTPPDPEADTRPPDPEAHNVLPSSISLIA